MGKTRDLFKKIRDTKGTFHAKMGSIKDRNGLDLTEAEGIKKRRQEYTEELYKKDIHDPDNHDDVITNLEPDILESDHIIMIIWVMKIFFVQFSVFLPPLLNIFCFCQIHTISVLYCTHLCMKYSLGISNFLEELSSLSHSIVFLYFFALITDH